MMVDDYSNVGETLFLADKSGGTLCSAFCTWYNGVKQSAVTIDRLDVMHFHDENELTNYEFRHLLAEVEVVADFTSVASAKCNGRVEWKFAHFSEGAIAAWLEYWRHVPDLEYPSKTMEETMIWPEAFV